MFVKLVHHISQASVYTLNAIDEKVLIAVKQQQQKRPTPTGHSQKSMKREYAKESS